MLPHAHTPLAHKEETQARPQPDGGGERGSEHVGGGGEHAAESGITAGHGDGVQRMAGKRRAEFWDHQKSARDQKVVQVPRILRGVGSGVMCGAGAGSLGSGMSLAEVCLLHHILCVCTCERKGRITEKNRAKFLDLTQLLNLNSTPSTLTRPSPAGDAMRACHVRKRLQRYRLHAGLQVTHMLCACARVRASQCVLC